MRKNALLSNISTYAVAFILTVFVGFPLFWMAISSLKPSTELFVTPPTLLPKSLTLEWYRNLASSDAPLFFLNSLLIGFATTIICLTIGTLAAYGMTRFTFPGKGLLLVCALGSYVFPAVVLFIPIYMIIQSLGLTDTLPGLVIAHSILTFPFALWMLRSFFENIPRDIDEAAWIDGASYLRAFISIIMPLALPGVFSVGVFVFVLSWNEFLFASVLLTSSNLRTIPLGIAELVTSFDIRWGEIMALGTLATVPVVILFLFVQKFFLKGVVSGAVKG